MHSQTKIKFGQTEAWTDEVDNKKAVFCQKWKNLAEI
jgi:hypothetical protein